MTNLKQHSQANPNANIDTKPKYCKHSSPESGHVAITSK
jgi:hypothetical protein